MGCITWAPTFKSTSRVQHAAHARTRGAGCMQLRNLRDIVQNNVEAAVHEHCDTKRAGPHREVDVALLQRRAHGGRVRSVQDPNPDDMVAVALTCHDGARSRTRNFAPRCVERLNINTQLNNAMLNQQYSALLRIPSS